MGAVLLQDEYPWPTCPRNWQAQNELFSEGHGIDSSGLCAQKVVMLSGRALVRDWDRLPTQIMERIRYKNAQMCTVAMDVDQLIMCSGMGRGNTLLV